VIGKRTAARLRREKINENKVWRLIHDQKIAGIENEVVTRLIENRKSPMESKGTRQ
jgi:hypothetical protein